MPLPKDRRLQHWLETLGGNRRVPSGLEVLSWEVGASTRTISRIFKRETGMSYQDWRQQWRLLYAIELLVRKKSIGEIAHLLKFANDSAFVRFFRQQTGETPLQFQRKIYAVRP